MGRFWPSPTPPSLQIQSNFCGLKWLVHVSQTFTTSFMWKCFFSKSSLKPTLIFTTLFQFRCTFEANVNSNLGKISLQAVCHHGEENLTGVSEKYNWNFDTNPTYWVVRYSVEHSHNGAFLAVQDSSIGDLVTHSLTEWVTHLLIDTTIALQ